jgi:dTDP-4-amino-4,6-dideoxygalactose transaminase
MGEMLGTLKQQWGKQKVEAPAETKVAVAERVVEKQIEAPIPPKLEQSDVAKLVEKMLQGAGAQTE